MRTNIATITYVYATNEGLQTVHLSRLVKPYVSQSGTKMYWLVSVKGNEFYTALRQPSFRACLNFLQ